MKKHWYFITFYECPVCGGGDSIRERRYGRKPMSWQKRYKFIDQWDGCEL